MTIWWTGKSRSKPKSTSGPREAAPLPSPEVDEPVTPNRGSGNGKAMIDESLAFRRVKDPSLVSAAAGSGDGGRIGLVHGQPLPLPKSISSRLPYLVANECAGLTSTLSSVTASSVSSTASSEETPDIGFCRYPNTISMPKERTSAHDALALQHLFEKEQPLSRFAALENPACLDNTVSSAQELQTHILDASSNGSPAYSHGQASTKTLFDRGIAVASPGSREHPVSTSPAHSRAFRLHPVSPNPRLDNLRAPLHPLPLPPSSPSSSPCSSHSPASRWKKGKMVGRGTFGQIYLGFNSESGHMCAIKEVKDISDDANSKECLRQLSQEIALLSKLSHPNIVQYYGCELAEDTLSVYLEYVPGGSIHKLLQEYGPFSESLIRSYTAQILSGLSYLHERNTVHRDIKGANILVDPSGEVKLADFGMAKHMSSYTSIRSFKGSPYWMAPEIIMNDSGYNLSVDIWSLGCTVLEMATSKPPWSQYEGVTAMFKIGNSNDTPEIPDHVSSVGKDFLRICLQRDPTARPSAAQLLDHPFVRDQLATKTRKFKAIGSTPSPFSRATIAPMNIEISSNNTSPLHENQHGMRQTSGFTPEPASLYKSSRNLAGLRLNMSLPASPCSSPRRQFRHSMRSCLLSPRHPAYSLGVVNYSPLSHVLYPTKPIHDLSDPWHDVTLGKAQTPLDSSRR